MEWRTYPNRKWTRIVLLHRFQTLVNRTEDPLKIKYVKILRIFLWSLGAWPGEILGEKVPLIIRYHRRHACAQSSIVLFGQILFLFKYSSSLNFFVVGNCYISTFLGALTAVRTSLPNFKKYGVVTKKFLMELHLVHFRGKSSYNEKMYTVIDKVSYYFTLYLMAMMVGGMVLFNVSPVYQNYRIGAFTGNKPENVTADFSVSYTFPGFNPYDNFAFVTIYNFYLSYNCAISVCSIDLLLSLMVFQIIGHIQILRRNLETIPLPEKISTANTTGVDCEMYDSKENKSIRNTLVECINHHRLIVSFADDISNFFGPMLGLNYLFHLVGCCLLLLECSQGDPDALIRFGPLTIIIFGQLIQLSITFEIVNAVSDKLSYSVYYAPWQYMNTDNRRLVCILLQRAQAPIQVTAMGMTSVGVQTMAQILKATFSYFTFLRSMEI